MPKDTARSARALGAPDRQNAVRQGVQVEKPASMEQGPSRDLTLEGESDLRQFLKVANPVWSISRRGYGNDVGKVVAKLKCIGVTDARELLSRVAADTINGDLKDAGFTRFSQDTLASIRKQGSFVRAVQTLTEASFRQAGDFATVPRLLSNRRAPGPSRDGARSSGGTVSRAGRATGTSPRRPGLPSRGHEA
ncbi:unnamed protein product, partial [Prorocentrum cordatum]